MEGGIRLLMRGRWLPLVEVGSGNEWIFIDRDLVQTQHVDCWVLPVEHRLRINWSWWYLCGGWGGQESLEKGLLLRQDLLIIIDGC